MKYPIKHILILSLFTALTALSSNPVERFTNVDMENLSVETLCPVQNSFNQSVMEDFLTDTIWAPERTETNTGSLTVSQITLLNDSSHSSVCTSFNDTYQEAFDEKNGIGETAKNITYYKAGNFYFVIITPRQSDDPNYITFGVSYLDIYDLNIDFVKGYAF